MARVRDLPFWLRSAMAVYPWRRVDPVPCSPLEKALRDSRVAVVTSAGLVPPGAPPFDACLKGGDFSYRVIESTVDLRRLRDFHRSESFDHRGLAEDRNLALPLDRIHALERRGVIGSVAPRHLSFMGSITAPGRLVQRTAPEAAALLRDDAVDIALLVPV